MDTQVIDRARLGTLTKIGQGGQGVVYRAPNVKTQFAASMVYKEYKSTSGATTVDYTALAAMPALVEQALTAAQARRLVSIAAWPCALVEDSGAPVGFVMPAIAERYFTSLTTVKGTYDTTAEFQHLLNHPSMLAARGITITDAQRYALLRETAAALTFLHQHGVCVGDVSPKNLLFSLEPHEAVYLIDCDAMRVNGTSALPQLETPGWGVPDGEELATIASDAYKLGLLALRLIAGDQDTRDPNILGPRMPTMLRQLITDTLTKAPQNRPPLEAWGPVLARALEQAQSADLSGAAPPDAPAPAVPVVHTKPKPKPHNRPPATPGAVHISLPPMQAPAGRGRSHWLEIVGGLAVLALAAVLVVAIKTHPGAKQPTQYELATPTTLPSPTYTPAYTPPPAPAPPPPPPDRWVAIAVASSGAWGAAGDYDTQDAADSAAMSKCAAEGGTNCKLLADNDNGCVAVAHGSTQYGGGHGATLAEAENAAQSFVGGSILASRCTNP